MDERLRWHGVARDALAVTSAVHAAVVQAGAWLERSEQYSNVSLSLVLGMDVDDVAGVARALAAVPGFEPSDKTRIALAELQADVVPSVDATAEDPTASACARPVCVAVVGRPWAPRGDLRDVFATLVLTYPKGDGSVARTRPPG